MFDATPKFNGNDATPDYMKMNQQPLKEPKQEPIEETMNELEEELKQFSRKQLIQIILKMEKTIEAYNTVEKVYKKTNKERRTYHRRTIRLY